MSEMIERVARALATSAGGRITGPGQSVATREFGWKGDGEHLDQYVEAHWKEYMHAAEFAIEAMREPTQRMRLAGIAEWSRPDPTAEHESTLVFNAVWRAMVDAALSRSP